MSLRQNARKTLVASLVTATVVGNASPYAFAETAKAEVPKIDILRIVRNGTDYDIQTVNRPDDRTDLKMYENGVLVENPQLQYLSGGTVRLSGYEKPRGSLSLERMGAKTREDGVRERISESTSRSVPVFGPEKSFLKQAGVRREILHDVPVYVIPVSFAKEPRISGETKDKEKRYAYSVTVNGHSVEYPLQEDVSGPYLPGKAYLASAGIVLHEKSLPDRVNRVMLKSGAATFNAVSVKKEADLLGPVLDVRTPPDGDGAIVLEFQNVRNIRDIARYEFKINDQVTVPELGVGTGSVRNTVSTGFGDSGPLTFKVRPVSLGAGEVSARVLVKEIGSSLYDADTVDLSRFLSPTISAIGTRRAGPSVEFKVAMNPLSLAGDYEKIDIVLNGKTFSSRGEKTVLKNPDGTTKKDMYGNESYEFVNRVDFRKTAEGLEFSFPQELLTGSLNTLQIRNKNTARNSAVTSFSVGGGVSRETGSGSQETVSFEPVQKNRYEYDPVAGAPTEIRLGTLRFKNVDKQSSYRVSAELTLDSEFSPFSRFVAGNARIWAEGRDGKIAYNISDERLGSSFPDEIGFSVESNEFLPVGENVGMSWNFAKLERLTGEGYVTVAEWKGGSGSLTHVNEITGCFDAGKDECGKNGTPKDSSATFAFAFGTGSSSVANPAKTESATGSGSKTSVSGKKNDPWKLASPKGNGNLAKLVHAKFSAAMEKLRQSHSQDVAKRARLLAAKKAFEKAVRSAENYESSTNAKTRAILKKVLIRDVKDAAKRSAEVAK